MILWPTCDDHDHDSDDHDGDNHVGDCGVITWNIEENKSYSEQNHCLPSLIRNLKRLIVNFKTFLLLQTTLQQTSISLSIEALDPGFTFNQNVRMMMMVVVAMVRMMMVLMVRMMIVWMMVVMMVVMVLTMIVVMMIKVRIVAMMSVFMMMMFV